MSLKNSIDFFEREDIFQAMIVGKVIDNVDPMKQGRCKIEIPSFTKGIDKEILPWMHQLFPVGTGTTTGIPTFKIPEIGTQVVCIFPDKDIYSGFYMGELIYAEHKLEELLSDYPETYGFIDKIKNKYWVNMKKKTVDIHHHTGTHLHVDDKGTMTLDGVMDLNINIDRDTTIHIKRDRKENVDGNYTLTVKGTAMIDVTGDATIKTAGNMVVKSGGTMDLTAGGAMTLKAPVIKLN